MLAKDFLVKSNRRSQVFRGIYRFRPISQLKGLKICDFIDKLVEKEPDMYIGGTIICDPSVSPDATISLECTGLQCSPYNSKEMLDFLSLADKMSLEHCRNGNLRINLIIQDFWVLTRSNWKSISDNARTETDNAEEKEEDENEEES